MTLTIADEEEKIQLDNSDIDIPKRSELLNL